MSSYLRFGSVRPDGWLAARMRRDLDGFVGHLDRLVPELIVDDDIYGRDRLTAAVSAKEVGAILDTDSDEARAQFLWWNSETQSNWRDGWMRHVMLVGSATERQDARAYVERMLGTIGDDGYLGIYGPDLRFPGAGENGELWAQATLGRALLAYIEAAPDRTHAKSVLQALTRAVDVTLNGYANSGHAFFPDDSGGGGSHGLMFVDVLDALWRLTGDDRYLRSAAELYAQYGQSANTERDAMPAQLLDSEVRFQGHGVHTYEHLRALVLAALADSANEPILNAYLEKLSTCVTPAGGPIGDEWVLGRHADATSTGYEFCSIVEYIDSLARLMVATGRLEYADAIERTCFNAAAGSWHPELPAIAYLQTDNAFSMTGNRHGLPVNERQTRYRYSPVHREAAVCCVPNAGRLLPTYVRSAVIPSDSGLIVALYGPMQVDTRVNGVGVQLLIQTEYPYGSSVELQVVCAEPVQFTLTLRKPGWAEAVDVSATIGSKVTELEARVEIAHVWHTDRLTLSFTAPPRVVRTGDELHVDHGALVYALPIESLRTITREYAFPGFVDVSEEPLTADFASLSMSPDAASRIEVVPDGLRVPLRSADGVEAMRTFVPLGSSALRRVTFPVTA